MSKTLRISALLAIDVAFALIELITGWMVHSLALVADSFHMFNDILSLIVALWAVQVSKKGKNARYTYGLQRAEILGALVNAVFLLALCVTILLEAIQRFIEVPEVKNPKLILVVGCLGLLSNFVGLVLFNEHGHSHGGGGHSHSHGGSGHSHGSEEHSHGHGYDDESRIGGHFNDVDSDRRLSSLLPESAIAREEERLLRGANQYGSTSQNDHSNDNHGHSHSHSHSGSENDTDNEHSDHHHSRPKDENKKSSRSMNMEGVWLHVLGDALGNVGVILTALFIWKTNYSWRFYADPFISVVITAIIFSSAVPLCLRASRVLLQATPASINTDEVRQDIESIPGVQEIHDLHIWQLSESQTVATLHVTVEQPPSDFPKMCQTIQQCFAGHGIPSITIQPEFTDSAPIDRRNSLRQCQSHGNLLN